MDVIGATIFPPNAGLSCTSFPLASILKERQSPVMPRPSLEDVRPPNSLPLLVEGNIIAQGSCLLIASDKILEYDALSKSISEFDSSYNILSAPKAVKIE